MIRQTFLFTFSLILCLIWFSDAKGQEKRSYGLRLGIDLAQFPYYFLEPEIRGIELSADAEIFPNFYPVIESGISQTSIEKKIYDYKSDGSFFRIGFDYNIMERFARNQYDMGFVGIRYGYSLMNFSIDDIKMANNYWGNYIMSVPEQTIHTHWIEFTGGIRAEVLHNFYMGWSVRGRLLLSKSDSEATPYTIPGYGKGKKPSVLGINYSIFYKIPVIRKKIP